MFQSLWQYLIHNQLEVLAFILSVAGVWLTAKEKVINWPINIAASVLYSYLFYRDALYGDSGLNAFFVVMCVYGWYEWEYGGKGHTELVITNTTKKTFNILIAVTMASSVALGEALSYTNSNVPYLDGITTALSLVATWMAARKLIENWLVWILADLIYVVEYIIKDLYLTAVLYFVFTLLAAYGYYAWKKQLTQTSNA